MIHHAAFSMQVVNENQMKISFAFAFASFLIIVLGAGCQNSEVQFVRDSYPSPNLEGAPEIPEIAVLRPYFQTTLGNVDAGSAVGTAFAIEHEGTNSPIVLTALSILGPASGLTRQAKAIELVEVFQTCTLGSAFGGFDGVVSATEFLSIAESAPFDEPTLAGDVLAIMMPEKTRVGKFKLSNQMPAKGETIWLSAAMFVGVPPSQRQHSAIVTGQDANGNITYTFDDKTISHQGTVGAPILNKKGEVIAIHLGGTTEEGKLTGFANPTARFSKHLESAVLAASEKL